MDGKTDAMRAVVNAALADRGWTASDLAAAAGVHRGTISGWLAGRTQSMQAGTQRMVEDALAMKPGSLRDITLGTAEAPCITLVIDPETWAKMSGAERVEAEAVARAAVMQRIREMGYR